jgi:hypothetical protein
MSPRRPTDDELFARIRTLAREQPTMTIAELYVHPTGRALLARFASTSEAIARAGVTGWPLLLLQDACSEAEVVRALAAGRSPADDSRLALGIARHFKSEDAALAAAGRGGRPARIRWTRDEVVRHLAQRNEQGLSLQASAVARQQRSLYDAAIRFFGSYAAAARPFGVRAKVEWTESSALAAIRKLGRSRRALQSADVPSGLLDACRRLFGSWAETCRRAGVATNERRPRGYWTRERVLEVLGERRRDGRAVVDSTLEPSLRAAIRRHFGSLDHALDALGGVA